MTTNDLGTFVEEADGTATLRYERIYPRPISSVWSAITQPERVADWLGQIELEPREGGRFSVRVGPNGQIPITGTVLTWRPPSILACSWAWPGGEGTVITYVLSEEGADATRLVFTHTGLPKDQTPSVLPGWHLYLERLANVVEDGKPEADFSTRHAEVRVIYRSHFGMEATECQPAETV